MYQFDAGVVNTKEIFLRFLDDEMGIRKKSRMCSKGTFPRWHTYLWTRSLCTTSFTWQLSFRFSPSVTDKMYFNYVKWKSMFFQLKFDICLDFQCLWLIMYSVNFDLSIQRCPEEMNPGYSRTMALYTIVIIIMLDCSNNQHLFKPIRMSNKRIVTMHFVSKERYI